MDLVLQVRDLITRFYTQDGIVHAVNGISFELLEGETLAIVGESGCGKSVTMMSLVRLIPQPPGKIESGQAIFHDGKQTLDLLTLPDAELRHLRGCQIGFVFQDPMTSLNPVLTIGEQIAESMVEHLGINHDEARDRSITLLKKVDIPDASERYDSYPHQFSGGMRQRVMLAIAIACTPRILIADEPTTALDVTVQAQIIELVKELKKEMGMTIIWITHDLGVVAGMADRVLVMYGGQVIEEGHVDDVYMNPQHPYTVGLLGALPRSEPCGSRRLVSIKGSPPELIRPPYQCPFAPRCEFAFKRCWVEVPKPIFMVNQHKVACFYDIAKGKPHNGM